MPKARAFFAVIGCLVLLCTSCATQKVIKKEQALEAHGDYVGAYTNILEGLQASPKSKKLLAQKTRVSELYAQDLLRSAGSLSTNDLLGRIQLLETAAQLECGKHDEITATLHNLEAQRSEISKRADILIVSTNLAEMVAGTEAMLDYIKFDPELRNKLIDAPDVTAHVGNLLTQLAEANDLRKTRKLALLCGELWHSDNLKLINEQIDAQLRYLGVKALLPPTGTDASLGNEMVCCLIRAVLAPDSQAVEAYQQVSKRLQEGFLPIAKVYVKGALSNDQKDFLQSAILRLGAGSTTCFVSSKGTNVPDLIIIINVTDTACKVRAESSVVYSKYYAGDTQAPNPRYDSLYIQYEQISANAQSAGNAYAGNPNLINAIIAGRTRRNANDAAAILASTPRYLNVPVYQDYQVKKRDLVAECRFQIEGQIFDGISGSNLCRVPIEEKKEFQFTETSGAHPRDQNGYKDKTAPADWGEDCLQNFVNSHLDEFAQKATGLYDATVLAIAAAAIGRGQEQTGIEMALAWATRSEDGRAIEHGQEVAEMRELQARFDRMCFEETKTSSEDLRTNIVKCVMAHLGGVVSQQNQNVGELVSKVDPMTLRRNQTILARPTQDISQRLFSGNTTSTTTKIHTTTAIGAAMRSTVTVFTDQGSGSGFIISTNGFIADS